MRALSSRNGRVPAVPVERSPTGHTSVSTATFVGLDPEGRFQIALHTGAEPVLALSTLDLTAADVGVRLVIAYENGDPTRPIVMGRVRERAAPATLSARLDGDRVVLSATREIELRCGDASIVLTSAGKVLIRGSYVLSRSRGANKIKGAFVDIN
jgi:hypothetical protein